MGERPQAAIDAAAAACRHHPLRVSKGSVQLPDTSPSPAGLPFQPFLVSLTGGLLALPVPSGLLAIGRRSVVHKLMIKHRSRRAGASDKSQAVATAGLHGVASSSSLRAFYRL